MHRWLTGAVTSFWNVLQVLTLPQDQNYKSTLLTNPQFNNLPCWVYDHVFVQTCFPSISALVWGLIALSWLLSRMKEICLSIISPAINSIKLSLRKAELVYFFCFAKGNCANKLSLYLLDPIISAMSTILFLLSRFEATERRICSHPP